MRFSTCFSPALTGFMHISLKRLRALHESRREIYWRFSWDLIHLYFYRGIVMVEPGQDCSGSCEEVQGTRGWSLGGRASRRAACRGRPQWGWAGPGNKTTWDKHVDKKVLVQNEKKEQDMDDWMWTWGMGLVGGQGLWWELCFNIAVKLNMTHGSNIKNFSA